MFDSEDLAMRTTTKTLECETDAGLIFQPTCPFCKESHGKWTWDDSVLTCSVCGHEIALAKHGKKILAVGLASVADIKLIDIRLKKGQS